MQTLDHKRRTTIEGSHGYRVEVIISTVDAYLHGHINVAPGQKVHDLLNSSEEDFVALSDVSMTEHADGHRLDLPFVTLNKRHIVSVIPVGEDGSLAVEDSQYRN